MGDGKSWIRVRWQRGDEWEMAHVRSEEDGKGVVSERWHMGDEWMMSNVELAGDGRDRKCRTNL